MAACDRGGYLDNQKVSIITETISREKKIQREYFDKQSAAGRLQPWQPPPPVQLKTVLQTVGLPACATTVPADPDLAMGATLSRNMWTSNPGYIARDGQQLRGTTHRDYTWDAAAVQFMKEQGEFSPKNKKRRDEFVMYVEAAAKAHHQLGSRPSAATATK